ncbi:MAG: sulfate adenylyltransferase subunit CysN [Bacteroidota bacterium]|jgi:sulfate adenylyltransferase subunit 1
MKSIKLNQTYDVLHFCTAGSVDDGKSTLIGRLLYDSKSVFEDQLASVKQISNRRGLSQVDLSLLTDGLKDEREQGITIDVAYRYFATPKRKFIIADTPGHVQYTRNMVTGASTSSLVLILVDARKGIVEQTTRHSFIASLLQIPHLVVCINKMDLVGYDQEVFEKIVSDFRDFAAKLDIQDFHLIPISALHGDNVVNRSTQMDWYQGGTLLHTLENIPVANDINLLDTRFPVQSVLRTNTETHPDYRGYAGQLASGILRIKDKVTVLPSGLQTTVKSIWTPSGPVDEAFAPQSITLELNDDIDISRGDMVVRVNNHPLVSQDIEAMICWLGNTPATIGSKYALQHTTKNARVIIKAITYNIDIHTLQRVENQQHLQTNDLARVTLRITAPIFYDPYRKNRVTGSFILIEEGSNNTVAAGMII